MMGFGGDWFQATAESCGLDQYKLAVLTGDDASVVRRWLSGAEPAPAHAASIVRLAARLGRDPLQELVAECAAEMQAVRTHFHGPRVRTNPTPSPTHGRSGATPAAPEFMCTITSRRASAPRC